MASGSVGGDPSLSSIDFLRYPASSVAFYLDNEELRTIEQVPDGPLFGFRTWRGQLEVKEILAVYQPAP